MPHATSGPRRPDDRRRHRGSVVLALLATLVLVLGACSASGDDASEDGTTTTADGGSTPSGPDDTSTTEGEPADTTTTTEETPSVPEDDGMVADMADGLETGLEIDDRDVALCVAAGWIDVLGEDRIVDAGAEPDELGDGEYDQWALLDVSSSEGDDLFDVVGDCEHDVVAAVTASLDEDDDLTDQQRSCLLEVIDDAVVEELLLVTFQGEDGSDTELARGYELCYSETDDDG